MYTVDYFIKKFEAIPEKRIIAFAQNDRKGNHCAYGWCSPLAGKAIDDSKWLSGDMTNEGLALAEVMQSLSPLTHVSNKDFNTRINPAQINNGKYTEYQQPTPKQRILAALYDIKKMQQPEVKEEKIKTVYVSVPETVKEQAQLIITNN